MSDNKHSREFLNDEQVNVGPCVVCGQNVWHTTGNAKEIENYREHGPVHKWHVEASPGVGETGEGRGIKS